MSGQRAIVYVDGFNLYYGCLQGTQHRWLDLGAFCQRMLPRDDVVGIKYFTARVGPRPWNPKKPQAQQIYLRALRTVPNLLIHYGHFLTHPISARLVAPPRRGSSFCQVWKTEEKAPT